MYSLEHAMGVLSLQHFDRWWRYGTHHAVESSPAHWRQSSHWWAEPQKESIGFAFVFAVFVVATFANSHVQLSARITRSLLLARCKSNGNSISDADAIRIAAMDTRDDYISINEADEVDVALLRPDDIDIEAAVGRVKSRAGCCQSGMACCDVLAWCRDCSSCNCCC